MNEATRTLLEALLVGAVALGAGLAGNALNPDGLSLTRDHFRTAAPVTPPAPDGGPAPATPGAPPDAGTQVGVGAAAPGAKQRTAVGTETGAETAPGVATEAAGAATDAATEAVAERLRQHGLQVLTHAEVRALFEDPAYAAGAYVFVDARSDDAYRAGHVPGAVQFDRYHPERHIAAVQAACAGALKVIVYCIGVDCEDSELAAQDLPVLGIDPRLIHVYVGGWTAWSAAGLPVETGARGGGAGGG
jgi:rhodanese-related sulfurtransferase